MANKLENNPVNSQSKALDAILTDIKTTPEEIAELASKKNLKTVMPILMEITATDIPENIAKEIEIHMQDETEFFSPQNKDAQKYKKYNELNKELRNKNVWPVQKEAESSEQQGKAGGEPQTMPQETGEQKEGDQGGEGNEIEKEKKNKVREQGEKGELTNEQKQEGAKPKDKKPPTPKRSFKDWENLAKGARSTGIQTAGNAIGGVVGTGVKALAALPPVRIVLIIIGAIAVIIAIIAIILFAAILWHSGKLPPETANAAGDYGQIQANLAASKIETLKKALDENVDVFIKQINRIKSLTAGKNKEAIKIKCDEIIKNANELKNLPAVGSSETGGGGPGTAGMKETSKIKIMDQVKELILLFDVVDIAIMETGVCDGNSNFSQKPYSRDGNAWCAAFVQAVYKQAGLQIPPTDLAPCLYAKMKEDPNKYFTFEAGQGTPQPGDIVFFHWKDQGLISSAKYCWVEDVVHVGIVKEVKSANEIITIEGNTSGADGVRGCVAEKARNIQPVFGESGARYFGRVKE